MRVVAVVAMAAVIAALAPAPVAADEFAAFKAKFGKTYRSADEEKLRRAVFHENMRTAAQLRSVNPHASFGANEFADMSAAEFKTRHNAENFYAEGVKNMKNTPRVEPSKAAMAKAAGGSAKADWRQAGAVTPVKNQGNCGSCWAFSSTGGVEGQWFLSGNSLTSISEQQFVSCDTIDTGCKGGLQSNAYQWALTSRQGNLVTEAAYPYASGDGAMPACALTPSMQIGATISGYHMVVQTEQAMAAFVLEHGPLPIGVDATTWQTYTGGVLTNCLGIQMDHGVLIVGFDDSYEIPYWIVKNSWGPIWGEEGYIRVRKGDNQCLISGFPVFPNVTVAGPTPLPGPSQYPQPTPPATFPQPATPAPAQGWVNLLRVGVQGASPQIFLQLSCVSSQSCIVAGGSNGVGFSVFNFSGEYNGFFAPMDMPNITGGLDMLLSVAVGGSVEEPHGVVSGMEIGVPPLFLSGPNKWAESEAVPFVISMMIAADRATGKIILLQDNFVGPFGFWLSKDGGDTFTTINSTIKVTYPQCAGISQVEIVDENTWYAVLGSNPATPPPSTQQQPSGPAPWPPTTPGNQAPRSMEDTLGADMTVLKWKNSRVAIVRNEKTGDVEVAKASLPKFLKAQKTTPLGETGCPFDAAIAKTVDGGKTWTTQMEILNKGFEMDDISCSNANLCVAVGSGFNVSDTPGTHVYRTADGGNTWTEVLNQTATASYDLGFTNIRFVPGSTTDVWLLGSLESNQGSWAVFYKSTDGGLTFQFSQQMNFIVATTDLSFNQDGSAFAAGMTALKTSTIMKYLPTGPPVTPAPMYNGNFSQKICPNSGTCQGDCQVSSFAQGECLKLNGGGSVKVQCDMQNQVLIQEEFILDDVCWGPAAGQMVPFGICLVAQQGTLEFNCGPEAGLVAHDPTAKIAKISSAQ